MDFTIIRSLLIIIIGFLSAERTQAIAAGPFYEGNKENNNNNNKNTFPTILFCPILWNSIDKKNHKLKICKQFRNSIRND